MPRDCLLDRCDGAHEARGFCKKHYLRFKRHGDPLCVKIKERSKRGAPLAFCEHAAKSITDDCLVWPYGKSTFGYGSLKINGKATPAHRYVAILAHGEPPTPKHQAAHSCGNGNLGCINPRHLRWASAKENAADRLLHGTNSRGERHGKARITEDQALQIKALRGVVTQMHLADAFGVSPQAISLIQTGKRWSWRESALRA